MNITITGPRSVGKSTIAKILSKKLKLKYYSSDEIGEKSLKRQGGLDKAIKSGAIHNFIKEKGYNLILEIYNKENFILDLSGGAFSSRKHKEVSQQLREIAKERSIVIGLLPSKGVNEAIKFLFEREIKRPHFKSMDKKELYQMVEDDFKKFPRIFNKYCNFIIYTKDKSPDEIVNEIRSKII